MPLFSFSSEELFTWIATSHDFLLLDVRNKQDFKKFQIEGPSPINILNVTYFDFMEAEEENVAKIPQNKSIRIVCAKEGSAKYVSEILIKHGFKDVGYLSGGIKTWGNLLIPKQIYSGPDYELYQFIRPAKGSCSYGLIHEKEIMFFDPCRNLDFYLNFAKQKKCSVVKTFETHLQADYIAGSRILSEKTGALFYANRNDFRNSKINYTCLEDNEKISFTNSKPFIQVMFTPGHTPGSTSFIIDNKFFITGDTVFIKSIGRPDLGGQVDQWAKLLFSSITKIKTMNDELLVLPGHFTDWQEADKKQTFSEKLAAIMKDNSNIYDLDNEIAFSLFIKANMRDQPPEYADIRRINANLDTLDDSQQEILDLGKNECAASAYANMTNQTNA